MRTNGLLIPDGVTVQYKPDHGPLKAWMARQQTHGFNDSSVCFGELPVHQTTQIKHCV